MSTIVKGVKRAMAGEYSRELSAKVIAEVGGAVMRDPATDLLTVNGEFTVSLVLARCQLLDNGRRRWKVRFDTSLAPDITVAVRLSVPSTESRKSSETS